jgi:hypothetical protein
MDHDTHGLTGYMMLLNAFIEGELPASAFDTAIIRLWVADRDLELAALKGRTLQVAAETGQEQKARELLRRACAGEVQDEELGHTWATIWACTQSRTGRLAKILDLLHSYVYSYTPDAELRKEDPHFYIDETRLRDFMIVIRDVLLICTDQSPASLSGD